ncbi:MAG: hypothetical protein FVQ77_10765 [Cytophagales bacterium]|nr:hypothetical protein [Cytophagales bacterium]
MKKFVLLFVSVGLFCILCSNKLVFAQDDVTVTYSQGGGEQGDLSFGTGTVAITAGYGFPNLGLAVLKSIENQTGVTGWTAFGLGPIHFRAEYGLSDKVGFALSVNYVSFGAEYTEDDFFTGATYNYTVSFSSISFLGRINVHFATTEKLDAYWGIGAGYRTGTWKFESNEPNYIPDVIKTPIPVGFETTLGLRYYFTDNIGAYIEIGAAKSLMQGGLAVKF